MIKISILTLFNDIKLQLSYISGKRATSQNDYFRHVVCETDYPLLRSITAETLAFMSHEARMADFNFSIEEERIIIRINKNCYISKDLLYHILLKRILHRWFIISGLDIPDCLLDKPSDILTDFIRNERAFPPLHTRPITPF